MGPIPHPLHTWRVRLLAALALSYPRGFCHHCHRPTEWTEGATQYVCRHCGEDPCKDRPDLEEPIQEMNELRRPGYTGG